MTIDERLDRLVERHEALAQSVELLVADGKELHATVGGLITLNNRNDARISLLIQSAESHERRIKDLDGNGS